MSGIRAVCFDVGGVMTHPIGPAFLRQAAAAGVDAAMAARTMGSFSSELDTDDPAHRLERGEIPLEEFLAGLGDVAPAARQLMDPASPYFVPGAFVPHEGMHAFVREVKARGYKTALITNSVTEWKPWWDRVLPEPELFDVVVHSCEVGLRKPGPGIFRLTLDLLGVEAHEALFLDDFPAMAAAGRAAGMVVIDVRDHDEAIAEARALLGI